MDKLIGEQLFDEDWEFIGKDGNHEIWEHMLNGWRNLVDMKTGEVTEL